VTCPRLTCLAVLIGSAVGLVYGLLTYREATP